LPLKTFGELNIVQLNSNPSTVTTHITVEVVLVMQLGLVLILINSLKNILPPMMLMVMVILIGETILMPLKSNTCNKCVTLTVIILSTNVKCSIVSSWLKISGELIGVQIMNKPLVFLDIGVQNVKVLGLVLIFNNKTMLS
jgi:prepilin signal peptidase PulO-like enzyme (type II secretory pathway)